MTSLTNYCLLGDMKNFTARTSLKRFPRLISIYLVVMVLVTSAPFSALADNIQVDIKVNGSDGPVTIFPGDSFSYSWSSVGSTISSEVIACTLTSPSGDSGVSLSGNGGPIDPAHPWYPTVGGPVTLTLNCTDGVESLSDSVVIHLSDIPPAQLSADIKANDSDGPVTIGNGNSFTYSWSSTEATACTLTSPSGDSGVSLSGNGGPIDPAHPWYPASTTATTLTLNCTNGVSTATDSVIINLQVASSSTPTADIKVNDSNGPVGINQGASWNYSWTSTNATACTLTSPSGDSGVSLSGNGGPIDPAHPWYPTSATSTTLTLNCTDGVTTATDQVTVTLNAIVPPVTNPYCADGVTLTMTEFIVARNAGKIAYTQELNAPTGATQFTWTITNETGCILPISLSVYKMYDHEKLSTQVWFDEANSNAATSTITLTVDLPSCQAQIDGWFGADAPNVLQDDNTIYGDPSKGPPTVIAYGYNHGSELCKKDTPPETPPGGGGGGHGRGRRSNPPGEILGDFTVADFCPFLTSYMKMGAENDPLQVIRLQAYLKTFEKFDYVTVNGVFDAATFQAVSEYQIRYQKDILEPWGLTQPTGYVYKLTLAKINQTICGTPMPEVLGAVDKEGGKEGAGNGDLNSVPTVGRNMGKEKMADKSSLLRNLAAAIFSFPDTPIEIMQTLYVLILILAASYILGTVLKNVLYKDLPQNSGKRFYAKWLGMVLGLVIALAVALILKEWSLVSPLILVVLLILIGLAISPKRAAIRSSVKAWYLVLVARLRSQKKKENTTLLVLEEQKK